MTATIDENGKVTTYYYDDDDALHGFVRDGSRYAVGADQVGTPRVVTDATGTIVKSVERDAWGRVTSDSAPGFELPIGFAGGIEDPDTKLVRFGLRDYDPAAGRFTARDPIFFRGSPRNLYEYAAADPVALRDPTGLWCGGGDYFFVIGGGGTLCYDTEGDNGWGGCARVGGGFASGVNFDPFGKPTAGDTYSFNAGVNAKGWGGGVTYTQELGPCGDWSVSASGGSSKIADASPLKDAWVIPDFGGGLSYDSKDGFGPAAAAGYGGASGFSHVAQRCWD